MISAYTINQINCYNIFRLKKKKKKRLSVKRISNVMEAQFIVVRDKMYFGQHGETDNAFLKFFFFL